MECKDCKVEDAVKAYLILRKLIQASISKKQGKGARAKVWGEVYTQIKGCISKVEREEKNTIESSGKLKVCTFCGEAKEKTEYYPKKDGKGKLMSFCKECHKERKLTYSSLNNDTYLRKLIFDATRRGKEDMSLRKEDIPQSLVELKRKQMAAFRLHKKAKKEIL